MSAPRKFSSQYRGAALIRRPDGSWWISQISRNRRPYYLGIYADELLAAAAYDCKAKELFGENAPLNGVAIPPGWVWNSAANRLVPLRSRKGGRGSKYQGVTSMRGQWRATMTINGKSHYLGAYKDEAVAAAAFDAKAIEVRGPNARVNGLPPPAGWRWDGERQRMVEVARPLGPNA